MVSQIASTLGALLILVGYVGLQMGKFKEKDLSYLHLNFLGGFLLLVAALITGQVGFIILEGSWVGITLYGYYGKLRGKA